MSTVANTDQLDMDWAAEAEERHLAATFEDDERRSERNFAWIDHEVSDMEVFDRFEDQIMGEFAGTHTPLTLDQVDALRLAMPDSWTEAQTEAVVQNAVTRIARGQVRVIRNPNAVAIQRPDDWGYDDPPDDEDPPCGIRCAGCDHCEPDYLDLAWNAWDEMQEDPHEKVEGLSWKSSQEAYELEFDLDRRLYGARHG